MAKSIIFKNAEEIELIRKSSLLVGKTLAEVAKHIKPGVTTALLDKVAETFIRDHGARPAFKGFNGFPFSLCISPNDVVVHGFPGNYTLQEGDILSVDCGTVLDGFYGDSAYTFAVGEISEEKIALLKTTKEALYKGIEQCVEGKRVGDISHAVEDYCVKRNYGVVRELVGHGVGKQLHEAPEIPNYGTRGTGAKLQCGMVVAIEPMINAGKRNVSQDSDGWTIRTQDKKPSAHFEHTVAIGKSKADILSSFEAIEIVLRELKMEVV
jgi:methionyl aminopeptidase